MKPPPSMLVTDPPTNADALKPPAVNRLVGKPALPLPAKRPVAWMPAPPLETPLEDSVLLVRAKVPLDWPTALLPVLLVRTTIFWLAVLVVVADLSLPATAPLLKTATPVRARLPSRGGRVALALAALPGSPLMRASAGRSGESGMVGSRIGAAPRIDETAVTLAGAADAADGVVGVEAVIVRALKDQGNDADASHVGGHAIEIRVSEAKRLGRSRRRGEGQADDNQ